MVFDERRPPRGSILCNCFILICLVTIFVPMVGVAQAPDGITRLAWLHGCWEVSTPGRDIEEYWMAPKGSSMLGLGRTMRNGVLADYEMMLIRQADNQLIFEAHPANQPTAIFHAIDVGPTRIIFENPKHDFPQRIGYERKGNQLLAWIEGAQNGKKTRIEFPYVRVACDPA